jgi:hypothetical protein
MRVIKFRRLRWARNLARREEGKSAFKIVTGKPPERSTHRSEGNVRMILKKLD